VIQEAWQESLLPRVEEEVNKEVNLGPPLDSSTIHWRPPVDGIVLLELFGGISSGLVAVLQAGLKVKRSFMLMWMRQLDRWPSDIHED
jgi:hypothetical protein